LIDRILTCSINSSGTLEAGIKGLEPKIIPVLPRAVRIKWCRCRLNGYPACNCGSKSTCPLGFVVFATAAAALCAAIDGLDDDKTRFSKLGRSKLFERWIDWRDWGRVVWGVKCFVLLLLVSFGIGSILSAWTRNDTRQTRPS
jgi:hypothetical protein